jgi:hypothetical protein
MPKPTKSIITVLKELTASFEHVGWVNGLTKKQYNALNRAHKFLAQIEGKSTPMTETRSIAKGLRERGHTIRQIAKIMGYPHPGSIHHLLTTKAKNNTKK